MTAPQIAAQSPNDKSNTKISADGDGSSPTFQESAAQARSIAIFLSIPPLQTVGETERLLG
jgi:hypothetical protein